MQERKKVGLALGSGSARGFAHIGVIRVLEAEGIPIDCIAGTSIGAIIGAIYAAGALSKGEAFLKEFDWKDVTALLDPLIPISGLLSGKRIEKLLTSFLQERKIEDFLCPFAAVATDVATGEEVTFTRGNAVKAIRASMSVPGIFTPVFFEDRLLVDGGLVSPVPVQAVRLLGADVVIAVNLAAEMTKRSYISVNKTKKFKKGRRAEQAHLPLLENVENNERGIPIFLKETIEKGRSFVEEQRQALEEWFDDRVEKGREVLNTKGTFLSEWFAKEESADLPDIFSVLFNAIHIMQDQIARSTLRHTPPDILLNPNLAKVRLLDFGHVEECIREGERITHASLSEIRQALILPRGHKNTTA